MPSHRYVFEMHIDVMNAVQKSLKFTTEFMVDFCCSEVRSEIMMSCTY